MKQQEVLRKIGGIISELSEQYQYLQSESEHLNGLELELFVANAHFLTDHAEVLRKISAAVPVANALPPVQEAIPEVTIDTEPEQLAVVSETVPVVQEDETNESVNTFIVIPDTAGKAEAAQIIDTSYAAPVEPEIVAEPAIENIDPENVPLADEPPATPTSATPAAPADPVPDIDLGRQADHYNYVRQSPEPETERDFNISGGHTGAEPAVPASVKPVLGATPVEGPSGTAVTTSQPEVPLTLNQRLSAQIKGSQAPSTMAASTSQPAIGDLKSAVSMNDKLLYVRDLFNGYNLSYSEALELLNRCKSFDEADRLLKANYVTKNNWAARQATADRFYALLHRRFAV